MHQHQHRICELHGVAHSLSTLLRTSLLEDGEVLRSIQDATVECMMGALRGALMMDEIPTAFLTSLELPYGLLYSAVHRLQEENSGIFEQERKTAWFTAVRKILADRPVEKAPQG